MNTKKNIFIVRVNKHFRRVMFIFFETNTKLMHENQSFNDFNQGENCAHSSNWM